LTPPVMTRALRVMIVEDNSFARVTLGGTLAAAGVDVVHEASSAHEALALARGSALDAALIDLDLGDGPTGADLAVALRRQVGPVGIVILTSFADPRAAGVDASLLPPGTGYLTKGSLGDADALVIALARAVRLAVTSGDDPGVTIRESRLAGLTDNQMELLRMVSAGLSNAEIARERGIGESAVERTVARVAQHLGIGIDSRTNRRVLLARAYIEETGGR
jgi:DNA-binding NarL/FixJ family response regulator